MIENIIRTFLLIVILFTFSKFILLPFIVVKITDPTLITILICSFVIMLTTIIPFIIRK